MSIPQVKFENNDKAAHAISHHLDGLHPSPQRFALRPYNRFSTEFTEWWFIPNKTEWPAYRCSKVFIHSFQASSEDSKWLYTGFYVEKGLGKQLARVTSVNQTKIMENDWYWYEFLRNAQAGKMHTAIQEVLTRSQCPVVVSLNIYNFNRVPEPDTARHAPYDWVEFNVHALNGDFQRAHDGTDLLAQLNTCTNLCDLAKHLKTLKGLEFFWLNLLIGIRLQYGTATSGNWGAAEIWHNALEPWNSWVK